MAIILRGISSLQRVQPSLTLFCRVPIHQSRVMGLSFNKVYQAFSTKESAYLHAITSNSGARKLPTDTYVLNKKRTLLKFPTGCSSFHTSQKRFIHPILWMFVKPVAKMSSLLAGRFFRKKWQKMDPEEKVKVKKSMWRYRGTLFALAALAVGAGIANYFAHLQSTPITDRVRYVAFTREQFKKIADFEKEMHLENNKDKIVSHQHPVYNTVISIAQRIVDANKDIEFFRDHTWTVWVVDDQEPNAFVLPNGHIFVYTGILKIAQTKDQLAVVLGHEMAHALLSHSAEQVSVAQLLDWIIIASLGVLWFIVPFDVIALVTQWFYNKVISILLHLPYSRKLELEADEVGLQLIAKACYDVRESTAFWSIMKLITEKGMSGFEELPEWISTHPSNASRVEKFNEIIPKAIDIRKFCKCAELPSKDPRDAIITIKKLIVQEESETPDKEESEAVSKDKQ